MPPGNERDPVQANIQKHIGCKPKKPKKGGKSMVRHCRNCYMPFIHEEIREGVMDPERNWCIRCIVDEKHQEGTLQLPPCYGIAYQASNIICSQQCQVSAACLIELIDVTFENERMERLEHWPRQNGMMGIGAVAERILRALQRPMHIQDLGPIVERETAGRFRIHPGSGPKHRANRWQDELNSALQQRPSVVDLGGQFYVWKKCWDLSKGGEVLTRQPARQTGLSLKKVFELIKKQNEPKGGESEG